MALCVYCEKEVKEVNAKKHCSDCVKLQNDWLFDRLINRDHSTLNFIFTVQELKEFASILNIKGRSKMNKEELVNAVYTAFNEKLEAENAEKIAENNQDQKEVLNQVESIDFNYDDIQEIGFSIINYHTGESLESTDLNALFSQLEVLEKQENKSGFYYFLVVNTCNMLDGEKHFFNIDPIAKYEVKTAGELKTVMIQVNKMIQEKESEKNQESAEKEFFVKIFDFENMEFVAGWTVKNKADLKFYINQWFLKPFQLVCIMIDKKTGEKEYFLYSDLLEVLKHDRIKTV